MLRAQPGIEHVANTHPPEHDGLSFQAQEQDVGTLSIALGAAGVGILALTPELATLEDLFFRLTEGAGAAASDAIAAGNGGPAGRHEDLASGVGDAAGSETPRGSAQLARSEVHEHA